ncbi:Fic family protein [Rhizobium ruizarguesonis]
MRGEYSSNAKTHDLQLEARAHIAAQRWIDDGGIAAEPLSVEAVCQIHKRFCELLPSSLLLVDAGDGGRQLAIEPGAIRTVGVQVGRHVAVSPGAVPRFLTRIEQAYKSRDQTDRILAAACGHHRLLWVHPFLDGNGRVARILSYVALKSALGTRCLWSMARGGATGEGV